MNQISRKFILDYFVKVLAQDFTFEYMATGTFETPLTWVGIADVESFNMETSKRVADTTSYDDNGVATHIPAEVSYKLTLDCLYNEAVTVHDPGQAYCESIADATGTAGLGVFQMISPGGITKKMQGSVAVTTSGAKDSGKFKIVITLSGAPVDITV